jgi:hypothetical protein
MTDFKIPQTVDVKRAASGEWLDDGEVYQAATHLAHEVLRLRVVLRGIQEFAERTDDARDFTMACIENLKPEVASWGEEAVDGEAERAASAIEAKEAAERSELARLKDKYPDET